MTPNRPELDQGQALRLGILATLTFLALAIRFWRLGDWNLEATEIFTFRDSIVPPGHRNPRPLIYFLNYYVVRPFHPLNEFGLRLLPAVFGVLAIPVLYWMARRLVGSRAALWGALLLTISPLHSYYSQFARYWSLVFLLCTVYPYALYLGLRDGNRRMLIVGVLTGVLAALAHPVSILLVGGLILWFAATHLHHGQLRELWQRPGVRRTILIAGLAVAVIVVYSIPVLQGWIHSHDKAGGRGQFLLRPPGRQGVKQILYLINFAESLTPPMFLAALAGLYLLWRSIDRGLALLLISLAVFPILFLTLISLRTPVSTYYLLPAVPVFFVTAGVFLDYLFALDWRLRPQWLVPTAVTLMIIAAGLPTLISDHRDGRRYHYRDVARWLDPQLSPGDAIFSDQHMVLAHYLPGREVQQLRDPAPLTQSLDTVRQSSEKSALWIVLPAPSHAFRTNPKLSVITRWMYDNCQLRYTAGVGRVDFRQNYLQTFRCPAVLPEGTPALAR